jgi:hypothetical protein
MNPPSGQAPVAGRGPCSGYILCLYAPDVDRRVDFLQADVRVTAMCATLKVRHRVRFEKLGDTTPHWFWTPCRDASRKDKM